MHWYKTAKQEHISVPYYRITTDVHFGSQLTSDKRLDPGTYWTPRWDAIILMLRQVFFHYVQFRKTIKADEMKVKVWQLDDAIMEDSPNEGKWPLYEIDAGEKILVKKISEPQLIFDEFLNSDALPNLITETAEILQDYSKGESVVYNGEKVYFNFDSNSKVINIVKRNSDGYSFSTIKTIHSNQELNDFLITSEVPENFDDSGAIAWFVYDMNWHKENELV